MRVAIETISWGRKKQSDLAQMFRETKAAGYEGVELWQHPEDVGDPQVVFDLLSDLRLKLLGVSGGSLTEKIAFVRAIIACEREANLRSRSPREWVAYAPGKRRPYVYVDSLDGSRAGQAIASDGGYVLALHPAMFKSVQTAKDAEALLRDHPQLRVLPDTGHLSVAGEDVVAFIDRWYDRLEAVHLKDWHAEFGRSLPFYSRGFTQLGTGDVDLGGVLKHLRGRHYDGWLVVDLNSADDPLSSAMASRKWLRDQHGI